MQNKFLYVLRCKKRKPKNGKEMLKLRRKSLEKSEMMQQVALTGISKISNRSIQKTENKLKK